MATQLLIYERAVPVSLQRHRDWSVKTGSDYGFAAKVNSVPLVASEVTVAAQTYPVIFAGEGEITPVVLLGVRDGENLFVKDGSWDAKYIPAFVRRYPFVFSSTDAGKTFTLCLDEDYSGVSQSPGQGERLFDKAGERTQYLKNVLSFLQAYQAQFRRTQLLSRKLAELDLFEPMQAQVKLKTGQQMTLGGFKVVNRDKLKALPPATLSELAQTDELEVIYAHLASLRNFGPMVERIGATGATAQAPVEPA